MMVQYLGTEQVSEFFDKEVVVAEIPKSNTSKYVITVGIRDGQKMFTMRAFYLKEGAWLPDGKAGMTVKEDYIDDFIEVLTSSKVEINKL